MALKNFDQINREKREIIVGGEQADVTKIPSRVMLELVDAVESGEIAKDSDGGFMKTLQLAEKICTPSNPKMTADFLLDKTDFETLIEVIEYIMEPVKAKMEEQQARAVEKMVPGKNRKSPRK